MKILESLGKSLTRDEQKRITGGCKIPNGTCNCRLVGQSCATDNDCCIYDNEPTRCIQLTCIFV